MSLVRSTWKGAQTKLVAPLKLGPLRAGRSGVRRPRAYGADYDETAARGVTPVNMAFFNSSVAKDR